MPSVIVQRERSVPSEEEVFLQTALALRVLRLEPYAADRGSKGHHCFAQIVRKDILAQSIERVSLSVDEVKRADISSRRKAGAEEEFNWHMLCFMSSQEELRV